MLLAVLVHRKVIKKWEEFNEFEAYGVVLITPTVQKVLKFMPHVLFPPDLKFIQIFVTGTGKFMQFYASSCNNYANLLSLFLLFLVQGVLR